MTEQLPSPHDYGLPHPKWRKHQYEVLQKVAETANTNTTTIISAPTGSGKTSFAAALGRDNKVIALTRTKALQEQYADIYGFIHLFGKGNYQCPLLGTGADRCKHKKDPRKCDHFSICPYYIRKAAAMNANRCALNYAYFMTASWPKKLAPQGFLFLDECHMLSDITIEHSSTTLTESDRREYGLSDFPMLTTKGASLFFQNSVEDAAIAWLEDAVTKIGNRLKVMELLAERNPQLNPKRDKVSNKHHAVTNTYEALSTAPDDWFIRSGRGALDDGGTGFVARPLTARNHFSRLFLHGGPTVLMSATVGDFDTFAAGLGIKQHFDIAVPNQWEANARPVYVWKGAPKISSRTSKPSDYEKQADIIARMVHEVPNMWSGVIHCSSIVQAKSLADRLAKDRGLQDRIWLTPRTGTNNQLRQWGFTKRRHHRTGMIAVAWSWWEGVDLGDERINITAKIKFPTLATEYARQKKNFDQAFYRQEAAWGVQQSSGRIRRGRRTDYDTDGQMAKLVAIVDGNIDMVYDNFDADFKEAITEWN